MMRQLVREVARKHGLTHARTFDMLVDFFESLIEDGKIVDQDLVDYFEEEMVEAAKAGEFPNETKFLVQPCLDLPLPLLVPSLPAPPPKKIAYDRLDANTKEVVKYLLNERVRVETPVVIKFLGSTKAVVNLMGSGYFKPQVAVVYRNGGMLLYNTVNFDNSFATVE